MSANADPIEATVSIARCMSNTGPPFMEITIRNSQTNKQVVQVNISLEDFALAITGRSDVKGSGILWRQGTKNEN